MKILDSALFDSLSAEARQSPRMRKNFNFHSNYDEPCQRMLNAIEPGSYVRPHRHSVTRKPECCIPLRGKMAVLTFDDQGQVTGSYIFGGDRSPAGLDIPPDTWHTIISLEEGALFFEAKPGPYIPLASEEMAPWAPAEGSPGSVPYLSLLTQIALDGR